MEDSSDDAAYLVEAQEGVPPYRPFRTRPTGIWIDRVAAHIKETGEPETFPGLYWGPISPAEPFRILRKLTIDRRKRSLGDKARCPRCRRDDKYIRGALAWFFDAQYCAAIGHCCADQDAQAAADRTYRAEKLFEFQEGYLLEGLPLLAGKASAAALLRTPTAEALRVFREFRHRAPEIHEHLRQRVKVAQGGRLLLTEVVNAGEDDDSPSDYYGPAGLTRSGVETREHDFGILSGQIAVSRNYDPVRQLADLERRIASFGSLPDEAEAMRLIIGMSEAQRKAAVAILQGVDATYKKLQMQLSDFWSFFTRRNAERLNAYGTHPAQDFAMEAEFRETTNRVGLIFRHRRRETRLGFDEDVPRWFVQWSIVSVKHER